MWYRAPSRRREVLWKERKPRKTDCYVPDTMLEVSIIVLNSQLRNPNEKIDPMVAQGHTNFK